MKKGLKKGFTLIELLVVIAIIGILATIVIINVAGARAKAVDTKVFADLEQGAKTAVICTTSAIRAACGAATTCEAAGALKRRVRSGTA